MKRKLSLACAMLFSAGLILSSTAARADSLLLTLSNPSQSGVTGNTLSYFATVSAPVTNAGAENLNGDSFSIAGGTLNDNSYFNIFPFQLAPGASFTGLLFTVFLPPSLKDGSYAGTFTILGGPTGSSLATLSTAAFNVTVTPEPASFLLLATGMAGLAAALRRRGIA